MNYSGTHIIQGIALQSSHYFITCTGSDWAILVLLEKYRNIETWTSKSWRGGAQSSIFWQSSIPSGNSNLSKVSSSVEDPRWDSALLRCTWNSHKLLLHAHQAPGDGWAAWFLQTIQFRCEKTFALVRAEKHGNQLSWLTDRASFSKGFREDMLGTALPLPSSCKAKVQAARPLEILSNPAITWTWEAAV